MRSKRFLELEKRPVNQDGFVKEWPEEGLIAMESPYDPKPSIKIEKLWKWTAREEMNLISSIILSQIMG